MKFGQFEVELDDDCLVVVNKEMKYKAYIGGDAISILDLTYIYLDGMEIPV